VTDTCPTSPAKRSNAFSSWKTSWPVTTAEPRRRGNPGVFALIRDLPFELKAILKQALKAIPAGLQLYEAYAAANGFENLD